MFAPWNAGATVFMLNQPRFNAKGLLDAIARCGVTTFCAPPTVWRMLIQEDLTAWQVSLREAVGAGEPLNPEIIEQVKAAWGLTIRDGYGQTETTLQIGNFPGQKVKPGAMGQPAPGYRVQLLDPDGAEQRGGRNLPRARPAAARADAGLPGRRWRGAAAAGAAYRTGDVAMRDADGYFTYVGRADDVFKASDYRISPFELESALIEHPAVAEAAVVPSPDPLRLAVPKAFVALAANHRRPARPRPIFRHVRAHLAPYKRVRRLEFAELPKTISGKIRRVELRAAEADRRGATLRAAAPNSGRRIFPSSVTAPARRRARTGAGRGLSRLSDRYRYRWRCRRRRNSGSTARTTPPRQAWQFRSAGTGRGRRRRPRSARSSPPPRRPSPPR